MNETQSPEASGVTALMLIGILLIPWVTLVVSEAFLWLYRRAVVRAMAAQSKDITTSASPLPPQAAGAGRVTLVAASLDNETADTVRLSSAGGALYETLRRARMATAAVYLAAGAVYAGLMAIALGVQSGTLTFGAWLAFTAAFAWPAVLTALLVDPPRRRRWRALVVIAYFVVFLLGALVPPTRWLLFGIFMANLGATIVAMVVRARRIQAVGPLVGAVLSVVGTALIFALAVLAAVGNNSATRNGAEMPAGQVVLVLAALLVIFAGGPVAAWLTLRVVAARYGRKRTSDQAAAMAALWLIFASIHSATFGFSDERWMAAGLVAFLAFAGVTIAGFRLLRRRAASAVRPPRLLVLRVFALGRRSRRLFDRFATRWRLIGSVQLIAGPDLASSTVEPHEFLDFLRRRLGDRFLDSDESIERALGGLDTDPDPDGRYRVTDFICRDHAWRTVFGRLAAASDVVLMDLRGFSTGNSGCTYELGELLNVVPVERITFIVDELTDEALLTRTLEQAQAQLHASSPNVSVPVLRLRVFRETGRGGLDPDRLLQQLCEAAAAGCQAAASSSREQPVAQAG
jgi:hypothetical protein